MPSEAEERDEIVPPCARKPQSPCKQNPRPRPNRPQPQGRMKITVNGKIVSNMEEALETIKSEMTSSISPPCEPGSKFAEFSSVISTQNGGSMNGPMDLGKGWVTYFGRNLRRNLVEICSLAPCDEIITRGLIYFIKSFG